MLPSYVADSQRCRINERNTGAFPEATELKK